MGNGVKEAVGSGEWLVASGEWKRREKQILRCACLPQAGSG